MSRHNVFVVFPTINMLRLLQPNADVFACAVNPNTSMVEAFDTYSPNDLSWSNIRDIDENQVRLQ